MWVCKIVIWFWLRLQVKSSETLHVKDLHSLSHSLYFYFFALQKFRKRLLVNLHLQKQPSLRKIIEFHLITWWGNFMERHSFRIVLGDSPETMQKLCLSTKFPDQKIRWNYGILQIYTTKKTEKKKLEFNFIKLESWN